MTNEELEFLELYRSLSAEKRALVHEKMRAIIAARDTNSGHSEHQNVSVTPDMIDRHLAGERVSTEYLNPETGETRHVAKDEEVPEGFMPMLGTVG